ncbi:uncharacterized protein PGRI_084940 [Penicillium griseofulvum]|uniref:Uncharacterized protein n=1 Tax=Penicillium patulum TaxID=5078 RepID=A0A135LTD1_PENPA|nr:uncharacterized protein PGRI_084940 [Penicillium griseofulvum]KXG52210.1 hypothetical protein PGRI_084940 [Penicillium griseofulvum]
MSDRDLLGRNIELLPIPSRLKSAYHLLQSASSRDSDRRPRENSSDDEETQSNIKRGLSRYGSRFEGWKFTILLAFITSLIVLLFNVGFLLYTAAHPRRDDIKLYPTKYQNAYSRGELHGANTVLYNSAIYETTAVFAYDVFAGPGSLAHKNVTDLYMSGYVNHREKGDSLDSFQHLLHAATNGTLDRLQGTECLDAFAQIFQKTYSRLLIVTGDVVIANDSYEHVYTNPVFNPNEYVSSSTGPYDWLCLDFPRDPGTRPDCNVNSIPKISTQIAKNNWTVTHYKVDYCLAEKQQEHCKLQYSLPITIIVITFNIFKAGILFYMWFKIPDTDIPILTIGDAIASFLRQPDRWITANTICISLLLYGLARIGKGVDIWKQELGSTVTDTLIKGPKWPDTLELNVIIANAPQLIFSFLYFAFNSLLTTMALGAEWSGYAIHRKGLRVSNNAQLSQRSQYFLSIPYRYSMPLLAASATLHWLISQSLFTVGIEAFDRKVLRDVNQDITTCGYSPIAIVSAVTVAAFMFFCLLGLSAKPFKTGMPVAGSCSLAISAACHPGFDPYENRVVHSDYEDDDMALLPIKWGAVPVNGSIGHCSFTSEHVDMPKTGKIYR